MEEKYYSRLAVNLVLTRINNGRKEILLQLRQNTGYMDNMYDFACSGHVDKGESYTQALIREAKEEIGISINENESPSNFNSQLRANDEINVNITNTDVDDEKSVFRKDNNFALYSGSICSNNNYVERMVSANYSCSMDSNKNGFIRNVLNKDSNLFKN